MKKIKKIFKTYSGLPRAVYMLFIVRVINAMGNFVYPFLTLFLTKNLGMSKQLVGIYVMAGALSAVPGYILGGKLSDNIGRKKILIVSQICAAICLVPCAFLGNSIYIPYFLILSLFFNSVAQPANGAMVADITNIDNRNKAYSLLYLGNNIGFSVGPMIAGLLYDNYIEWVFLGNAIAIVIAVIIMYFYVKESIPTKEKMENTEELRNSNEKAEKGSLLAVLIKRPVLFTFALLSTVYSFVYAQFPFCIPMQINDMFKVNSAKIYGTIMATNGITVIALTTVATRITRKINSILNVACAGVFFALGFGMLYFVKSYPLFIFSTVVWSIGEILNTTNSGVYIANHTPMSHRGRFNAVIPLITGAGFAFGPAIMGRYLKNKNVIMAWPVIFILSICTSVGMYILYIIEKKTKAKRLDN